MKRDYTKEPQWPRYVTFGNPDHSYLVWDRIRLEYASEKLEFSKARELADRLNKKHECSEGVT